MKRLIYCVMLLIFGDGITQQTPQLVLPEAINTNLNERDFTISPDGTELYFTRSHFNNKTRAILRVAKKEGKWGSPEIATFSGRFNDLEPFFSPDGARLYFASNRSHDQTREKKDFDIWYVERSKDGGWSPAKNVGTIINTEKDEFYPAVTATGTLYFTAIREDTKGTEDIYKSVLKNGTYQTPESLPKTINTTTFEFNAYVNPAETLIIFSSYGRADDIGGSDLYYSVRSKNGKWQPAKHMGNTINSESLDYCPYYSESSKTLYFTSNVQRMPALPLTTKTLEQSALSILNGYGNIYQIYWEPELMD